MLSITSLFIDFFILLTLKMYFCPLLFGEKQKRRRDNITFPL